MSVPQMPTPATSTTTSVRPGAGSSNFSTDSFPGASKTTARMSHTSFLDRMSHWTAGGLAGLPAAHGRVEDDGRDQDRSGDHEFHRGGERQQVHPVGDGA